MCWKGHIEVLRYGTRVPIINANLNEFKLNGHHLNARDWRATNVFDEYITQPLTVRRVNYGFVRLILVWFGFHFGFYFGLIA